MASVFTPANCVSFSSYITCILLALEEEGPEVTLLMLKQEMKHQNDPSLCFDVTSPLNEP